MLKLPSRAISSTIPFQNSIEFVLNGKKMILESGSFDPTQSLAQWLRLDDTGLKGTKIACGEGGCGACTVIVSSMDPITKTIKHRSVNSCLMPVAQCHHQTITTIEALGTVKEGLDPVQHAFVEHHATQCGYCTPGFIMNAHSLFLENPEPTVRQIDEHFDGNLCRCTGYRAIHEAMRDFAKDGKATDEIAKDEYKGKTRQVMYKPEVPKEFFGKNEFPVALEYKNGTFFIPTTINELIEIKKEYPNSMIVVGGSEVEIDIKYKGANLPAFISTHRIPELYHISIKNDKLVFGANTSLQDIEMFCKQKMEEVPEHHSRLLRELRDRLAVFSSTQIRNTASVVGNIVHAGAVTDMSNFLLATDALLHVTNAKTGEKRIETMDNFFTGYRQIKLAKTDIITEIEIPLLKEDEHCFVFKQAHRREDDICIVSSCFKVSIDEKTNIVKNFEAAYSGMAAFPQRAPSVEKALINKEFTIENIEEAMKAVDIDLPLDPLAPGGHVPYRRELARSFLFRFFHQTEKERGRPHDESACGVIERGEAEFSLAHRQMKIGNAVHDVAVKNRHVHSPAHHRAAAQQTTGEAIYTDDSKNPPGGLYAYFVLSTVPHAKIVDADYSECLKQEGVVDIVTYKDIQGVNLVGDVVKDETVLAEDEVTFVGHPIAMVLAESQEIARKAAKLAKITYKELPSIVSIKEAIEAKSFYSQHHNVKDGDVGKGFAESDFVIEGECSMQQQNHFYLEAQTAQAIPGEDGRMTVYAGTQNPTFTQTEIANVLGVPMNKVDVHVKRLGGGFGCKETRSIMISNAVAVAAQKVKRPVRMALDRSDDMQMMGCRHPFYTKYKVGFNSDGKINALKADMYADCGWCLDLSLAITDRALLHVDSAYKIPNLEADTWMCKTNNMSHTAFRGFGAPQGFMVTESVVEQIANKLNMNPEEIRYRNLYREGDATHFRTVLNNCNAVSSWNYVKERFDISKERKRVDEFNRTHKYKKRGIAMTPLKFGIAFTFGTLNQAGCLIHIYKDGTVLLSHGGVEMGQGLHTKMCQVAATTLNIPVELVHIDETATDKVANTSATAASSGADLNGHAVYNACMQINQRLNKYRTKDRTWVEAIRAAWADKVDLCAHGYYGMPDVGFDFISGTGSPFQYYVYGASCSEVEIDCLTGDHQVLRTDLVFDAGDALNPAIDLGQVEGAFIQGYGLFTLEEFVYGDRDRYKWVKPGVVQTNGPGYYKIPGWNDVPLKFNVGLLPNSSNPLGVYSSKAVGEPPLLLAVSIPLAMVDAIKACRKENGLDPQFELNFPMTSDRIRMLSAPMIEK